MSYASTSELTAYATNRGITLTGDLSVLLAKANDYIESIDYQGSKADYTQETKWPRSYVWVDGYLVSNSSAPQGIKNAEMRCAIEIDSGDDPLANIERATKEETLGDLTVIYSDTASEKTRFVAVDSLLKPYLANSASRLIRL